MKGRNWWGEVGKDGKDAEEGIKWNTILLKPLVVVMYRA